MSCDFTFKHYEFILNELLKQGYLFLSLQNVENNKPKQIILRHDIDFGLKFENALDMAEIENKLKIKSTWYVILKSPFYNLFSVDEHRILSSLISSGHEIGLHFDGASYLDSTQAELENAILNEKEILEALTGNNINSFSFHRPASSSIKVHEILPSSLINAYDNCFTSGSFIYASDSRRNWKDGCICQRILVEKINNLQLLVHPFWWNSKNLSLKERFDLFYDQIIENHEKALESNIRDWKEEKLGTKFA